MIACDIEICVGCRMCEVACATARFGAVSPALARIRVAKLEETGIDFAVACVACVEKPCLQCPNEALSVGARGEILVAGESCNGCGECVEACPIGAVGFHDGRPLFCDVCGGAPACVPACPSRALSFQEDGRAISLQPFLSARGSAGEKRTLFACARGEAMRAGWASGRRIDS
jgi:carbon-monoxide dehydrogenase iron sulfur subunit